MLQRMCVCVFRFLPKRKTKDVTSTWVQVCANVLCKLAPKILVSHKILGFATKRTKHDETSWNINPAVFVNVENHHEHGWHEQHPNIYGPFPSLLRTDMGNETNGPPPTLCCKSLAARHWHHLVEPQTHQSWMPKIVNWWLVSTQVGSFPQVRVI